MQYLAIDPGNKRTGLAVGSDVMRIATPLEVVQAANEEQRLAAIRRAIADHEPGALVLGLPLNMDGTEGPAAKSSRELAARLEQTFQLPVHLHDERLTSDQADQQMSQTGLTHGQKKSRRDALAAAVILQDFLDSLQ